MQSVLLRKSTKVRRPDSPGDAEKCQRPDGLSGKRRGVVSTVRTGRGNLTITGDAQAISVGYEGHTIRRTGGRRNKRYAVAKNRQTTNHSTDGKLIRCRCGRSVIPAYHLEGRCEDCYAEDQERFDGKSRNIRLFHTVR
jgi:hypothetical protein